MNPLKLRTKSVYSDIEPTQDGLRILTTRYRGRGMSADRYDVWMANLGPSEALLKRWQSSAITWGQYVRLYRAQLFEDPPLDQENPLIKNHGQKFTLRLLKNLASRQTVTLMCHCLEEEPHCHRHVLQKLILRKAT